MQHHEHIDTAQHGQESHGSKSHEAAEGHLSNGQYCRNRKLNNRILPGYSIESAGRGEGCDATPRTH
jgi:hypothetical protein